MSLDNATVALQIPSEAWTESGPDLFPRARLLWGGLVVCGIPMHVEAYAVIDNDQGEQVARYEAFAGEVESLQNASDCSFHETTIDGLPYFIVATPYER